MTHRDLTEIDNIMVANPVLSGINFDLTIGISISEDVMEDVFITAIEGGSNYWADFVFGNQISHPDTKAMDYKSTLKSWGIDVYDVETGKDFLYSCDAPRRSAKGKKRDRTILTWDEWTEGFKLYAESDYARGRELVIQLMQNDAGEADAEDAYTILQFAIFGEVVFG